MDVTENSPRLELYPVAKSFELVTGRRPSSATIARWISKGLKGNRLVAPLYLGRRCCTVQTAREFLAATCNQTPSGGAPVARTNRAADAAANAAELALERAGA